MKITKRFISGILVLVILAILITGTVISTAALTTFTEGDYDFTVADGKTCMVYSYHGSATSVTLPETAGGRSVVGIYDNCFLNSSITSVVIPDRYKTIGGSAFCGCEKLVTATIPSNLQSLGSLAFSGCKRLRSLDFSAAKGLAEIPYGAFLGDTELKTVVLPSSVKTIAEEAFMNTGLTTCPLVSGVSSLGTRAFKGCTSLSEISIPSSLKRIPDYAFYGCTSLTKINIIGNLRGIGAYAFAENVALSDIELPYSLVSIGEYAFYNDSSLSELFVPDSVSEIGAKAFYPMGVQKTLQILCYKGTYAEEYCYENWVNYKAVDYLLGDVNIDGSVNVLDATIIQKYQVGLSSISSVPARELSDVNKDGEITIRDATLIQMYAARIITEF